MGKVRLNVVELIVDVAERVGIKLFAVRKG